MPQRAKTVNEPVAGHRWVLPCRVSVRPSLSTSLKIFFFQSQIISHARNVQRFAHGFARRNETAGRADSSPFGNLTPMLSANSTWYALAYRPTPAYDSNASCAHTIDSDPHHSRTGGLHDVERKARSEAQARGESGTGAGGCRFVVAGGGRLGRDKRSAGGGPASSSDHAESRNHPRRGRAFRRQPVDLLCLRQRERQVSAW